MIGMYTEDYEEVELKNLENGIKIVVPLAKDAQKDILISNETLKEKYDVDFTCMSWTVQEENSTWKQDCTTAIEAINQIETSGDEGQLSFLSESTSNKSNSSYWHLSSKKNRSIPTASENTEQSLEDYTELVGTCTCQKTGFFGVGIQIIEVPIDPSSLRILFYQYSLLWSLVIFLLAWIYLSAKEVFLSKNNNKIDTYDDYISVIDYRIPLLKLIDPSEQSNKELVTYYSKLVNLYNRMGKDEEKNSNYSQKLVDPQIILDYELEERGFNESCVSPTKKKAPKKRLGNEDNSNSGSNGPKTAKTEAEKKSDISMIDDSTVQLKHIQDDSDDSDDQEDTETLEAPQYRNLNPSKSRFYMGFDDPIKLNFRIFLLSHEMIGLFSYTDPFNPRIVRLLYFLAKCLGFYFWQSFFYTTQLNSWAIVS